MGTDKVKIPRNTPNRKRAIDNMCKSCIYDPTHGGGTWKQQVAACTATQCPLYKVRPLSNGVKEDE